MRMESVMPGIPIRESGNAGHQWLEVLCAGVWLAALLSALGQRSLAAVHVVAIGSVEVAAP